MNPILVRAPNPGLFTGPGTNTWIVASAGSAVVIDPGPEIESHREATLAALVSFEPVAVLVTHHHPDHAPAANSLAAALEVPAIGPAPGPGFSPDRLVSDGDVVACGDLEVVAVATPGHTPDSTCYRVGEALFTGDHIMGGSTVIVEDMAEYLNSLRRLQGTAIRILYPGHGDPMPDAQGVIAGYLAHRLERERMILEAVRAGAGTLGTVVETVYRDVDPVLHSAAALSAGAHLRKLAAEGAVVIAGTGWDAQVEPR